MDETRINLANALELVELPALQPAAPPSLRIAPTAAATAVEAPAHTLLETHLSRDYSLQQPWSQWHVAVPHTRSAQRIDHRVDDRRRRANRRRLPDTLRAQRIARCRRHGG